MRGTENPCLSLALARLTAAGAEHFAIWVLSAPYPGGMVHHDRTWSPQMSQTWLEWQEMFSLSPLPHFPIIDHAILTKRSLPVEHDSDTAGLTSYSSRLMQRLGIQLWTWLFEGPIQNTLAQSQGIAIGKNQPLRLRLEIRDPNFISLPWEIMQPIEGKPAIALSQQLLFSRTTSDVDPLQLPSYSHQALNILLVLGQAEKQAMSSGVSLHLEREVAALMNVLQSGEQPNTTNANWGQTVPCQVTTLIQPTPAQLSKALESNTYNIFFYAGHGEPAPNGGLLFLRPDAMMSGTELAQVLVRARVMLAVFNACWGAQPDCIGRTRLLPQTSQDGGSPLLSQAMPRSSLAEVLIHHGVPAVLAMRDSITDQEALSFTQALAQALASRMPVDRAVALARQHLLTLYKFNQPAWTLPVLYMHPEFDGELIRSLEENITELPGVPMTWVGTPSSIACLRSTEVTDQVWPIRGGRMRVGRGTQNDLVIPERWASYEHAEIICREAIGDQEEGSAYFLRDKSRNGTLVLPPEYPVTDNGREGWQKIHYQEVPLQSGSQLKFGSPKGQALEFVIEMAEPMDKESPQ